MDEILFKIRASFVAESVKNGMDFDVALEKSFNQMNTFLSDLSKNDDVKEMIFDNVKKNVDTLQE